MHMSFWWSSDVDDFLVYGFNISSPGFLSLLCICVVFFSFFFEWLRYLQTKQRQRELILRAKQLSLICANENTILLARNITDRRNPLNITVCDRALLFGTDLSLWFALQSLGYILMLIAMLYNGWLFIACIIGGGLGYFVFGQKFMKINMQNCQIIRDTYCMATCGEPGNRKDGESTPAGNRPSTSSENCHMVNEEQSSNSEKGDCMKC
ncbi:copper transporter 5-like isoform X1 [Coccinella septempunctata]|uniref:copper transporter 5-like isoform X1 n=1 Tax=Coccinella septempunctata TaxID=41139 RepID=UPI001D06A904|nr:copper transporter 5-like isoform X1 [Coccinella septempunctata]